MAVGVERERRAVVTQVFLHPLDVDAAADQGTGVVVAELVHSKGALLIVSVAEALSLGLVKPPAEADIVSLEAQSFGVPLNTAYSRLRLARAEFAKAVMKRRGPE